MADRNAKVGFIIDAKGNKTHAVVPIDIYEELLNLQLIFSEGNDLAERENYFFAVKGVNASGFPAGNRSNPSFMLNKGSMIAFKYAQSLRQPVVDLRTNLIEKGIIILDEKLNCYVMQENYLFTSPSFAASLVAGNNRNGLDVWTNKDGYTLKASGFGNKNTDNE
jgi:hypothetical protein